MTGVEIFFEGSVLLGTVWLIGFVTLVEGSVLLGTVVFVGVVMFFEGSVLLGTVGVVGVVTFFEGSVVLGVGSVLFGGAAVPLVTLVLFFFMYSTHVFLVLFQIGSSGGHY